MIIVAGSLISGRYRLERQIGTGAFTQIFLASDARLKRRVAVQVLESELVAKPDLRARVQGAIERIAEVDHSNILSIYDYDDADGMLYLITPFGDGGTLAERLRGQGRLGLQEAGNLLGQAAAALDYAHERGIVHGGVSPQNMLLRDNGKRLLLTDFGLANALGSAATAQTRADVAYLAPEQFQGNVGRATDVYALGCILFEMLTGAAPFTGSPEHVRQGHEQSPPPSIIARSAGQLPESLQIVIEIALAKRPEDRFRSAGELASAFQEACAAPGPVASGQVATLPPAGSAPPPQAMQATVAATPPPTALEASRGSSLAQLAVSPAAGTGTAGPTDAQALAERSWGWIIAQSWWVVVPLLTLSLLSWAVFLYIGFRAQRVRWLLWGLVYFVAVVIIFTATGSALADWAIFLGWFGSIVQAAWVARPYLLRLAGIQAYPGQRSWIF